MIEKQTLLDLIDKLYADLKPDELIVSMGMVTVKVKSDGFTTALMNSASRYGDNMALIGGLETLKTSVINRSLEFMTEEDVF